MPKRRDIKKILVVGAGPIIIGQACEFDYSGTQACKALKDEGYKVILINSNPATIMTDPGVADKTYIEARNAFYQTQSAEQVGLKFETARSKYKNLIKNHMFSSPEAKETAEKRLKKIKNKGGKYSRDSIKNKFS